MPKTLMHTLLGALLLLAAGACETRVDKETGERTTRSSLPTTEAAGQSWEARWQRCIEFNSRTVCERRMGRPPQ